MQEFGNPSVAEFHLEFLFLHRPGREGLSLAEAIQVFSLLSPKYAFLAVGSSAG